MTAIIIDFNGSYYTASYFQREIWSIKHSGLLDIAWT